ncbi:MAG: hypothetical protein ACLT98_18965 [Eggerthellaceae bacterium]
MFNEMGAELKRLFADAPINKILTIEASGIGIAAIVAQHLALVFARRHRASTDGDVRRASKASRTARFSTFSPKKYIGPKIMC